ncbi:hypothetical protein BsWGS_19209 [Bradybaena similaris]
MFLLPLSSPFSKSRTTCCCVFIVGAITLVLSQVHGGFQTMNDCYQFCRALEEERAYWLWCVTRICRSATGPRYVLAQEKRGQLLQDDISFRREIPPLLDLIHKRVKEFWEGPVPVDVKH